MSTNSDENTEQSWRSVSAGSRSVPQKKGHRRTMPSMRMSSPSAKTRAAMPHAYVPLRRRDADVLTIGGDTRMLCAMFTPALSLARNMRVGWAWNASQGSERVAAHRSATHASS